MNPKEFSAIEREYFRAKAVAAVRNAVRKLQPEDAIAVLEDVRKSYRTFDEIFAEEAVKAKPAPMPAPARVVDDGNFG